MAARTHHRGRWFVLFVAVLAVVVSVVVWTANTAVATHARYVTEAAALGDVTQVFSASGTVSRDGVSVVSFDTSGTVSGVKVAIGDKVQTGDTLATLDSTSLKIALLDAEATQAQAQASLYSAQHPTAASGGSGGSGGSGLSGGSGGSGASSSAAARAAMAAAQAGGSSSSSGAGAGAGAGTGAAGLSNQQTSQLLAAVAEVVRAEAVWSSAGIAGAAPTTCDKVYQALGVSVPVPTPTPTPTPEPTPTPSAQPTTEPTSPPTTEPTEEPTTELTEEPTTEPTEEPTTEPSPTPTPTSEPTPEPSATASAFAVTADDVTTDDITTCGKDRAALAMATVKLSVLYNQLITAGNSGGSGAGRQSSSKSSSVKSSASSSRSSVSSSVTVSKAAVARAQASLLQAEQATATAQDNLDAATLTAPRNGTVGALSLVAGQSSSGGSVTIVGSGKATVSIEVPLTTRKLIAVGQAATVVPSGSLQTLDGQITSIDTLETSGTAGDSPTYTTLVKASDPSGLLVEGSRATVQLQVITSKNVVTVPVSAVTPTGANTGTVLTVDGTSATTATTATVAIGAVGDGLAEIKTGLDAGKLVVLADTTAPLPSTNANSITTLTRGTTAGGVRRPG